MAWSVVLLFLLEMKGKGNVDKIVIPFLSLIIELIGEQYKEKKELARRALLERKGLQMTFPFNFRIKKEKEK